MKLPTWMTFTLLLLMAWFIVSPALPQTADQTPALSYGGPASAPPAPSYFTLKTDPPPDAAWFARVEVRNIEGSDDRTETVNTPYGDLMLSYETSPGILATDPAHVDDACVELLPDGVIALPPCVTVIEGKTDSIYLLLFTGG